MKILIGISILVLLIYVVYVTNDSNKILKGYLNSIQHPKENYKFSCEIANEKGEKIYVVSNSDSSLFKEACSSLKIYNKPIVKLEIRKPRPKRSPQKKVA